MDLNECIARASIRDLVARYNQSGDSGRIEELVSLFAEDAVLQVKGQAACAGKAAIQNFLSGVAPAGTQGEGIGLVRHHVATHQIDYLDPMRALGRCYFSVYTEQGLDHWGVYRDEYSCDGHCWRFQSRLVSVDGSIAGGWAESALQGP